jgi:hypothetical protein
MLLNDSFSVPCRAEKSRLAAKDRRDREVEELTRLAQLLPFDESVTSKLDKGSILRLTIDFFRMKSILSNGQCSWSIIVVESACALIARSGSY